MFAVLRGMGPVGLRLEAIHGGLESFLSGRVALGSGPVARLDQCGSVCGARITIAGGPVPIDLGAGAVGGRILHRHDAGLPVPLFGGQVAVAGGRVTQVRCQVSGVRVAQHLVDLDVPFRVLVIPCVGDGVALIGEPVATIGDRVTLVRQLVALVRGAQPLLPPALQLGQTRCRIVAGLRRLMHLLPPILGAGVSPQGRKLPSSVIGHPGHPATGRGGPGAGTMNATVRPETLEE